MKHVIKHGLARDVARRAAANALAEYCERFADYAPEATWVDDRHVDIRFRVKGIVLKGGVDVTDDEFVLELEVPLLLRPFQKRAIGTIDAEVRRWIDEARRGGLKA